VDIDVDGAQRANCRRPQEHPPGVDGRVTARRDQRFVARATEQEDERPSGDGVADHEYLPVASAADGVTGESTEWRHRTVVVSPIGSIHAVVVTTGLAPSTLAGFSVGLPRGVRSPHVVRSWMCRSQ
jgi:hypothetical protein